MLLFFSLWTWYNVRMYKDFFEWKNDHEWLMSWKTLSLYSLVLFQLTCVTKTTHHKICFSFLLSLSVSGYRKLVDEIIIIIRLVDLKTAKVVWSHHSIIPQFLAIPFSWTSEIQPPPMLVLSLFLLWWG